MPSFAIEVEGEANPLTRQAVLSTLQKSSGQAASQQDLTVATQQLSNWERTPGYYAQLQNIYADFSLPQEVRFQAIIQLKNGIDKYWRKTSIHAISKDDREMIKTRAIEIGIREPFHPLAEQNASMLGKIVRYEFPHDWPDVITTIIEHLRTATQNLSDYMFVSNLLNMTLQVIKELASGRLQRTKRSLQQVASELLQVLGNLYITLVSIWTKSLPDNSVAGVAKNSHTALKTLRRLLVVGFENPHRESDVRQFWSLLQTHHGNFWSLTSSASSKDIEVMSFKHLLQLSKLYLQMARDHPASFVLLDSMQALNQSWTIISATDAQQGLHENFDWNVYRNGDQKSNDNETEAKEKLALKALLLFRACVKMVYNPVQTFKYVTPEDKADRKAATEQIKNNVLTTDLVMRLMEVIVTQYLVLRPADLRDWEEEPDEWERREDEIADAWEFSMRSCSEKLFLDLIINYKQLIVPRLLQVFLQYARTDNTDVLLKDSLYSAVGVAAACLDDVVDINSFVKNTLIAEVQMVKPGYNMLRRRTSILLGQWVPIKPETLDRVAVYQIFTHLLSKTDPLNDQVVRVTAGRQLRMVLEPFEFNYEDFAPYATSLLSSILMLISESELSETKMALLETVRVAVTKLEGKIEPYANGIMSMLPTLWAESGEEHLMKQAILTMITALVTSLGKQSYDYHALILPLVHDSVQPESEAIVYLLDEALELWSAVLQQTASRDPAPSQELLSLTKDLIPLLDMGSEHLRPTFELTESYNILSPRTVLDPSFLMPLLNSLKALLPMMTSPRARHAAQAPHVLENLAATISVTTFFTPSECHQATQHLLASMISSGYLRSLLQVIFNVYDYHQDPRPNRKPPDTIGPAETSLFTLLSRIALASPPLFLEAITAASTSIGHANIDWFFTEWLAHFDTIGDALRKKLCTLAVTAIFASTTPPPPYLLSNIESLMTIWTDIITELGMDATEESQGDYLFYARPNQEPEWPDATPEDGRKRIVSNQDPIYAVNIRVVVGDAMKKVMREWNGGAQAFERELVERVDRNVLEGYGMLKLI